MNFNVQVVTADNPGEMHAKMLSDVFRSRLGAVGP